MKAAKTVTAVFFAVLTLAGLLTCADYGLPCDELAEQQILRGNMHEYARCLLGRDSAAAQWYAAKGALPISESIEKDHGQAAYYAFVPVLTALEDQPHVLTVAWKMYTWLWFMVGVFSVYGFCREMGISRPISAIGSLLLYLCPRFFAEGHYNNKDVVLLALALATLWLGLRFLKQPGFRRGVLFSLAGALAANTKIVGALPWGLMGLCAVVLVTARRQWSWRMLGTALSTVACFAAFYTLLTPAMWTNPWTYLKYLLINAAGFTRWPGVVLFRGMIFDHDVNPLPRYYLIWMMLVTLPLYVVPLAAAGQLAALVRVIRQKAGALRDPGSLALTAVSFCWFLPLLAAVGMRPLVYNGWRHFYFVYAGVVLLAAYGVQAILRHAKKICLELPMHRVIAAGLCLLLGWQAWGIVQNHPNQYAYYNRLDRTNAEADMELDYWNVSTVGAMEQLLACKRNEELPLVLTGSDPMSSLGVELGHQMLSPEDRAELKVEKRTDDAPYILSNTTYARIYGVKPPEGYHPLLSVKSYGLKMCTIYEKDE